MQVRPSPVFGWRYLALLPALACLACSGNSDGLCSVRGKVLYKGNAAPGVLVTFHPKGGDKVTTVRPTGTAGEDGTFTLTTGTKDGAPAGDYVITFVWPEEVKAKNQKGPISLAPPESRDRLKGAYAHQAQSKFKAQIKAGSNQLDPFELK
jgi:hypothetical protein